MSKQIVLAENAVIDLNSPSFKDDGLRAAVLGESGSGKSNTGMLLVSQWVAQGFQALVLDAHGEFGNLWELRPSQVERIGYGEPPVNETSSNWVMDLVRRGRSVLVDLSHWTDIDNAALVKFVQPLMVEMNKFAREKPKHRLVLLEEAHQFVPQQQVSGQYEMVRNFVNMLSGGRKFGLHFVLSSQRPGFVDAGAVAMCNLKIFHRVRDSMDWKKGVKPYLPKKTPVEFGTKSKRDIMNWRPGEVLLMSRWFDTQRVQLPLPKVGVTKFLTAFDEEPASE